MKKCVFLLVFVIFLVSGCGKSKTETFQSKSDELNAFIEKLRTPYSASKDTITIDSDGTLAVAPVYKETYDNSVNTDILMQSDINPNAANQKIDLMTSCKVAKILNIHRDISLAENCESAEELKNDINGVLGLNYIVIVRQISMSPIEIKSDKVFKGGDAHFNCVFYDLQNEKVVSRFDFHAKPSDTVSYTFDSPEEMESRFIAWVQSSVWENSRAKLIDLLKTKATGTYTLS